jgi:hypothetical protein
MIVLPLESHEPRKGCHTRTIIPKAMKLPVIPTTLALVSLVIATTLVVSEKHQESKARNIGSPVTKKSERHVRKAARIESDAPPVGETVSPATLPDESASLSAWQQQFQELLASGEPRENAVIILARNIDQAFSAWVATEITAANELTGQERIDRLVLAETQVKEGAALIYEQLEISGGHRIEVAADAIESLAAEIQYADAAADHDTRLAMLRLMLERNRRIDEASAMPDESAKTHALRELDHWYESRMGELAIVRKNE